MKKFKTENQIWAELIYVVSDWAKSNGYSDWIVKQGYQPEKIDLEDKIIMIHKIHTLRYNWQETKTIREKDSSGEITGFYNRVQFLVDSVFQFSFYNARKPLLDGVGTITSIDVANNLLTWFMSDLGLSTMRQYGYGLLRTTELREPIFVDPSDNYQKMTNFDIVVNYAQQQDYDLAEATVESPYKQETLIKGY